MSTTTTRSPVRELPPSRRRPSRLVGLFTKRRVVSSLLLAVATALLLAGLWESEDQGTVTVQRRPAAVTAVFPGEGTVAPPQQSVGAALSPGLTGELEIDRRPIPADQTERPRAATGQNDPAQIGLAGLNQVSFTPGKGKEIEALEPGDHRARIFYWPIGETRQQAKSYEWDFSVG